MDLVSSFLSPLASTIQIEKKILHPALLNTLLNNELAYCISDHFLGFEKATCLYDEVLTFEDKLKPARIGRDFLLEKEYRGDSILFLTDIPTKDLPPVINELIFKFKNLRDELFHKKVISSKKISIQLAKYPPNSHYVRHRDTNKEIEGDKGKNYRKITLCYYINKSFDGGELRLYLSDGYSIDVEPILDRAVLFQSDVLEHEVLTNLKDRFAITCWFYNLPESIVEENERIFINVVAYRDYEVYNTINNLFDTAKNPEKIVVGVVIQEKDCDEKKEFIYPNQVRIIRLDYKEARGPCFARHLAQSLFKNEEYVLQIDSHMKFENNWDAQLKKMLSLCPSSNPMLTSYPPSYEKDKPLPSNLYFDKTTILVPTHFDNQSILRLKGHTVDTLKSDIPLAHAFFAAGFNFSRSNILKDVPYDPYPNIFFGEEAAMSVRLWTAGVDFFSPSSTIIYHLYDRSYRPSFREVRYENMDIDLKNSIQRIRYILGQEDDFILEEKYKMYGRGSIRTLEEYQVFAKVNFKSKSLGASDFDDLE